jgi:hypothetical protein
MADAEEENRGRNRGWQDVRAGEAAALSRIAGEAASTIPIHEEHLPTKHSKRTGL